MIRSIYSHMNIGQTRLAYILSLLAMEVICIKVFNLPMAGYTKMEMKRMYKNRVKPILKTDNCYRTYKLDRISSLKVIKYRLG